MTVSQLRDALYTHSDVAVTMRITDALNELVEENKMVDNEVLTSLKLEEIRRKLYKMPLDSEMLMLALLPGASKNPNEAALQYIEALMR